ncbi:unnamed protein product [Dracunculus medinensis]|uniref:Cyclin-dependent kinases regulatory subunit n=1 Tax=Dracunculus medinensis TaxID=318479 RepID=A0A0N4U4C9_DRAME|nr:unnamed protein product [Dracunculus medinensis]
MYRYLLSIEFACRHVIIPRTLVKFVPKDRLMTENEWRDLGIQQSRGWENYMVHARELHNDFRRRLTFFTKSDSGSSSRFLCLSLNF